MFVVGGDGVVVVSILYNDVICNFIKTPRFNVFLFSIFLACSEISLSYL